jgi:hypothetical protein
MLILSCILNTFFIEIADIHPVSDMSRMHKMYSPQVSEWLICIANYANILLGNIFLSPFTVLLNYKYLGPQF